MKTLIYRFCLLTILLAITGRLCAQKTTLAKTLEQNFDVNSTVSFELINKYGDITISGKEGNQATVKIKITTYGKDDDDAKKMMDRVEFDFNVTKEYVVIETVLDRNKSVITEFLNVIGDYSKSLLSKNELNIDFEIHLPYKSNISINNKFGNVVINDISGKVTVDMAHGDFEAGDLQNLSRIKVYYGNASVGTFKTGSMEIKGGDLEIEYAEKISLNSSSSELYLKAIGALNLESTSDKIRISNINQIRGKTSFSNIDIYKLETSCDLDQSFGELFIHKISKDFKDISLYGKSTDYNLNFTKGVSFQMDVNAREDKLRLSEFPKNMDKKYIDDKEKSIQITGKYGSVENESRLKIRAMNGDVTLDFVQNP